MTKNKNFIIRISAVILTVVTIYIIFHRSSTVSTDNSYLKSDTTILRPKVNGYITQILVNDNQLIAVGDVIAKIDDDEYQFKVLKAQAQVDVTKAQLLALHDTLSIQELAIKKAAFQKDAAKASFERADKDANRSFNLSKDKAISQKVLDKAIEEQNNTKNAHEEAITSHSIALLEHNKISNNIKETEALLDQAMADLALAKLDLTNTTIKAPVSGIISTKTMQIGQLVSSSLALGYIVQNNIWVLANLKETQINRVAKDNDVKIFIDGFPDVVFKGKVDSLSPATGAEFSILPPENATGNFTKIVQRVPVKIKFDQGQNLSELRSGLSAQVQINLR